jgi:polyhydroxybutyrate depolymerase
MRIIFLLSFVLLTSACTEGSLNAPMTGDLGKTDTSADASTQIDLGNDATGTTDPDVGTDVNSEADAEIDTSADMAVTPPGSAGCIDGAGIPEGENIFMLEGLARKFIMRLPQNYSADKSWPIVFALHGNGGNTSYWDGTSGDRNIRNVLKDDAILIVAEAIDGQWRDYNADASTWPARIELELLYFDTILTHAKNNLCINESAIFTMGFSGGGSFSGVLGCRRTDIRAMAVGGSVIYFDEADCVGKPAAWITIGTQELVAGREQFRDFFRDLGGCDATSTATAPAPCTAYDSCDATAPVHYCQHPDGHIWPDFGSPAMWDFFSQFVN